MSKENDFNLDDASSAARRLSPESTSTLAEELKTLIRRLDEQLPDDPSVDPVTQIRSALDYTEVVYHGAPELSDISDRTAGLLQEFISTQPDEGLPRVMEGAAAIGMVGSLGSLRAAIDQDQVEFMFNNPSDTWQDLKASQTLFDAVRCAKRLLNELAGRTKNGKKKIADADELIDALQIEIARQLGVDIKAHAPTEPTKRDKIKKIGGQIIGQPTESSRIRW